MTRKFEELEEFCSFLLQERNGNRVIGHHTLDYWIGKKFGISPYIKKMIKESLIQFQLVDKKADGDSFRITMGIDLKKEAEEELRSLGID